MTQQQIIEKVHGLKTKMDLLNLLNELKREAVGGLSLPENLAEGDCIELSKCEIEMIFHNKTAK